MGALHENIRKKKRRNITMAVNISNWSELAKRFLVNKVSWAVKGGGGEPGVRKKPPIGIKQ